MFTYLHVLIALDKRKYQPREYLFQERLYFHIPKALVALDEVLHDGPRPLPHPPPGRLKNLRTLS